MSKLNKVNYIAIIPARKNSKRLIKKNLQKIGGKTMFTFTLDAALNSKKINKILITTDIPELLKKDTKKIHHIRRPKNLCQDHNSTESAVKHAVSYICKNKKVKIKNIVLLQPTSPFRDAKEIDRAIKEFEKNKLDSMFSAYKDKLTIWRDKPKLKPISYSLKRRVRSQFTNDLVIENGAIYMIHLSKDKLKYIHILNLLQKVHIYWQIQKRCYFHLSIVDYSYDISLNHSEN